MSTMRLYWTNQMTGKRIRIGREVSDLIDQFVWFRDLMELPSMAINQPAITKVLKELEYKIRLYNKRLGNEMFGVVT